MKVLNVIGYHHSGKTTVCEELMKTMKRRSLAVSSIKDIHNESFTMEKEGSNSDRHLKAHGQNVFARGLHSTYLIWNRSLDINEMFEHLHTEWVVIEGMKELPFPKILCAKDMAQLEELFDETVFAISGPISESIESYKGIPAINAQTNISELCDLVVEKVFKKLPMHKNGFCGHCGSTCYELTGQILKGTKKREDCGVKEARSFELSFNGEKVMVNSFVEDILSDVLKGICQNLKGYKEGDEVKISFKKS